MMQTLRYWAKGVRLYIALCSGLVTVLVVWWADTAYRGTSLFPTRIEETYAWLATGLLTVAITIGPVYKLFPRAGGKQLWFDARRLIGISAAWFASLHAAIAYFGQFGGANPLSLPSNYQTAFLIGGVAAGILLAMAFTSFDAAFKAMGIWWFRLHRLVYLAILAALLHAFMIGVHATHGLPISAIALIGGLILLAYGAVMFKRRNATTVWQLVSVSGVAILFIAIVGYGINKQLNHDVSLKRHEVTTTYVA